MNSGTAQRFAQSIASFGVDVQDAIDANDWQTAAAALEDIASDCAKLQAYVDKRLADSEPVAE